MGQRNADSSLQTALAYEIDTKMKYVVCRILFWQEHRHGDLSILKVLVESKKETQFKFAYELLYVHKTPEKEKLLV